jgi:hypothetical protein
MHFFKASRHEPVTRNLYDCSNYGDSGCDVNGLAPVCGQVIRDEKGQYREKIE